MSNLPPGCTERDISDAATPARRGRRMSFGEFCVLHPATADDVVADWIETLIETLAECHDGPPGSLGSTLEWRWNEFWVKHAPESAYVADEPDEREI